MTFFWDHVFPFQTQVSLRGFPVGPQPPKRTSPRPGGSGPDELLAELIVVLLVEEVLVLDADPPAPPVGQLHVPNELPSATQTWTPT